MTASVQAPVDVVCLGESMVTLLPTREGRLADVPSFVRGIGGAESNVACALAAAGHRTRWVGRVGADGFGDHLVAAIAAYGVDTSAVARDAERPTGVYFRTAGDRATDGHEVLYYRAGSAASAMSPGNVRDEDVWSGRVLHLSGITAALSPDCLALMRELTARREGRPPVSFDVNHRPGLWRDAASGARVLLELARGADIVFVGEDEAEEAWGLRGADAIRAALPEPAVLVVKRGAGGAVAFEREVFPTPPHPVTGAPPQTPAPFGRLRGSAPDPGAASSPNGLAAVGDAAPRNPAPSALEARGAGDGVPEGRGERGAGPGGAPEHCVERGAGPGGAPEHCVERGAGAGGVPERRAECGTGLGGGVPEGRVERGTGLGGAPEGRGERGAGSGGSRIGEGGAAPGLGGGIPSHGVRRTGDSVAYVPAPDVRVVAATGAGDAFAAGFLGGCLRGLPVKDRLRYGHLYAAAALTVAGDLGAPPAAAHADRLVALDDDAWGRLHLGPGWTGADQEVRTP
ncbi:PfkB family carbohydrate kinase [Streptomyces sp. 5K101]|uniref:PfkB family carbohydrate kinase n=1 Tax=Streptomyces sp. 5K101 TaxID=3390037 RepID=UPI003975649F